MLGEHRSARLAEQVLRIALSTCAAERAYLVEQEAHGPIRVVGALSSRGPLERGEREQLSRSICQRGFDSGLPIATSHADLDERLRGSESVQTLALRSVAFVPIRGAGESSLGIYVEDRQRPAAFGEQDLELLGTLARLTSGALAAAERRRAERRSARRLSIEQRNLLRELDRRAVELAALRSLSGGAGALHGIVARSPAMLEMMRLAARVARAGVPVLVHGESGTGKELIARAIHAESPRSGRAFVAENCGAIPETLLESALFGHVKGAFTGADRDQPGLFEAADSGTLFLDEIGEMSAAMQVRLLRVLEDGQVRRVGSTKSRRVDVRVVAASHRDLSKLVESGAFREDLFFRLAVVRIDVPPLRQRVEDVPLLVAHFLEKHGGGGTRFSRAAMDRLLSHPFPGNVRELENEVRRGIALSDGEIRPEHLALGARARNAEDASGASLRDQVNLLERRLIEEALAKHDGNQSRAAVTLGVSRYGLQK
ncbi:MAG: sigma-54-dependent Fis family transcriptional regulator, partial [Polyangiaceae bacterium]|nr:sigma-54-dependent Fis family transcriptional regulator [Polyangiaceae bacterium]